MTEIELKRIEQEMGELILQETITWERQTLYRIK